MQAARPAKLTNISNAYSVAVVETDLSSTITERWGMPVSQHQKSRLRKPKSCFTQMPGPATVVIRAQAQRICSKRIAATPLLKSSADEGRDVPEG
jgi:hypothetical protein